MRAGEFIGSVFGLGGRLIGSASKVLDITDNLLDVGVAITEDTKLDAQVDKQINSKTRADKLAALGITEE